MAPKESWDNASDQVQEDVESPEECKSRCEDDARCRQYSFDSLGGVCKTRANPKLGVPKEGMISGWIQDRVIAFEVDMTQCEDGDTSFPVVT